MNVSPSLRFFIFALAMVGAERAHAFDFPLRAAASATSCDGPVLRETKEDCPGLNQAVCNAADGSKVKAHLLGHTLMLEGEVDSAETKDRVELAATQYLARHCPGRAPANFEASSKRAPGASKE